MAPPLLGAYERELFKQADVAFTGGRSLYEAKKLHHRNIHRFPSSIDANHFGKARLALPCPADIAHLTMPRLGFFGVIDERMDLDLVATMARARPERNFVIIGPVVKVDPESLPQLPNIHWIGGRDYSLLPDYIASWDIGIMPFALNESTRFISPTKTPEFLAAGCPVVSTPITDVVSPYGIMGLVEIASTAEEAIMCVERLMQKNQLRWLKAVDAHLDGNSWDRTWAQMNAYISAPLTNLVAKFPLAKRSERPVYEWLVVGAGFAGSVLAERLANERGERVLVVDRRPHIGGNAYDHHDDAGILIHKYGPHIFHTNSQTFF